MSFREGHDCGPDRGPSFRIDYEREGPVQTVTATVAEGARRVTDAKAGRAGRSPILKDVTALGYLAGGLTTLSFLPQVVRSVRMRSAAGLSWLWLLCFGAGVAVWVAYGIVRGDPAIIAANSATLLAVLVLVWLRANAAAPVP